VHPFRTVRDRDVESELTRTYLQRVLKGCTFLSWLPRIRRLGESRPVSRVLSWAIIHLGLLSPASSSNLPEDIAGRDIVFLFGLAPGGVYHATSCYQLRGALLPHHFTLTCKAGGIFSVALSVGSRPPGVTWHPALWSPDFPPFHPKRWKRDCLADSRGYCPLPGISLIVF